MLGRRLAAFAVGGSCLLFAAFATAGPPQVTIYLPGYGQPQPTSAPPGQPPSAQSTAAANAAAANVTLQAEVAIAQATAYQRYLTYVALASSPAARAGGADPSQYFSNGAAAMTVPSAGQPGSSYFSNGAEATRVPGPPPPPPSPPQASPQPPPPPQPSQPQAPSAPLAPFWWVEGQTPAAAPEPVAPPSPSSPPPPQEESADVRPAPAMSFAEWLKSMGAEPEDTAASDPIPTLTSGDVAVTSIAEPSTAVLEVRQRAQSALREKPREHVAESAAAGPGVSTATAMGGTFVAGLLLGAFAMKRQRLRARAE